MNINLLQIRAAKENERGPLYMEPALSALHSLSPKEGRVNLEVGYSGGKIAFFVRGDEGALRLSESQLYAQYPDIEIDHLVEDPFKVGANETVISADLTLAGPEIFPIKRHPQFDDMLTRVNVDPIAGITSTLARYAAPNMRGHIQIVAEPLKGDYRHRALRFLPLLKKGFASTSTRYASLFARVQLARGWKRILYMPLSVLMGGFRAWPGFNKFFKAPNLSATFEARDDYDEDIQASMRSHDREDALAGAQDKINRLLFSCNVRVSVITPKEYVATARQKLSEMTGSFRQFALPQSNEFSVRDSRESDGLHHGFVIKPFVLSTEEVATLWHLPTILLQTPNIDWVLSRKLEPPGNLPIPGETDEPKELTALGEAVFRGQRKLFGIRQDDRRRHMYVIGKTGMGKSTLLENMIFSDIHAGKGVGVIDPHGDLIDAVLQFVPKERSNDVILFDPADKDYPISFNVLDCRDRDQRVLTASGIMSVFTKLWPDVWSGRMEHILRNTLLALLDNEGSSMLGIMRMYADPAYRRKIVSRVQDPVVKSFWQDEFEGWSEKYRTEALAAIQNKIGQLLSTPMIRNIVGQVQSRLDIRHAMDSGKIVLVNLSKGKLGEDTSAFLGSMLVTKFQIDAMSRADIPEDQRRDFFLYVDEFQNFATESFATILSEARKYRLSLTMANQYVSQLMIGDHSNALRDAVFGNVGSLTSFQVGSDDAEIFSLQYEEAVTPKDILSLPKYHAYVRLMIDGMPSKPFSVSTLPPPDFKQDHGRIDILRKLSRERYADKRETVESQIRKWAASSAEARKNSAADEKAKEKEEEEIKKAKKKGMSLNQYRAWRDKEMWTNEFNALRKKKLLDEDLSSEEKKRLKELEETLKKNGGIPEISKSLKEQIDKKDKGNQ